MQVLPGHESITTTILFSTLVVVQEDGSEDTFLVRNGLFLFDNAGESAVCLLSMQRQKRNEHANR